MRAESRRSFDAQWMCVEDVGHRIWLHGLAEDLIKAEDMILQLRHRRETVLKARSTQAARAPVPSRPPMTAVSATPVSRAPPPAAIASRSVAAPQEHTRLLRPAQAHAHYDATCGSGWRVDVERQREQSYQDTTCEDVCLSVLVSRLRVVIWTCMRLT